MIPKTKFDWMSTDSEAVEKYYNDPACGFVPTTRFFADLFEGLGKIHEINEINKIPKELPIFLFSGSEDPVGDNGKGVWSVAKQYNNAGIEDVTVFLFEGGRHEMLHEKNRQHVFKPFMTGLKKMSNYPEVIAIVGPTASGKTALSVELAKIIGGEVINGDAMQVYKGLDIGTAKITVEEMDGIPHHMFDIKEPDEPFSVAEYQAEVRKWITDIQNRGKIPIITGGTGLYIQSVLYDFRFTEEAADLEVRKRLEQELVEKGAAYLYEKLVELDPVSAEKIHPNNHRRLVRALEIIEVTGKTKEDHEDDVGHASLYDHLIVGLEMDSDVLYERIGLRVDIMMEKGLLGEASRLWNEGIRGIQSVQAIGYKELHQYIEEKLSLDEAVELIKKNTRNYAKRQMTYFRNKLDISWFDAELGTTEIVKKILEIMKDFDNSGRIK